MVSIGESDDSLLVMGDTRVRVYLRCKTVVSDSRAPVALLAAQLRFAIARKVTKMNQRLIARYDYSVFRVFGDVVGRVHL